PPVPRRPGLVYGGLPIGRRAPERGAGGTGPRRPDGRPGRQGRGARGRDDDGRRRRKPRCNAAPCMDATVPPRPLRPLNLAKSGQASRGHLMMRSKVRAAHVVMACCLVAAVPAGAPVADEDREAPRTMAEVLEAASPEEWRMPDPEDTVYL